MDVGSISIEKRGRNTAILGLVFQIALGFVLSILYLVNLNTVRQYFGPEAQTGQSLYGLILLVAGGILLWLALIVVYHQRLRVAHEALEAEELDRERQAAEASALFVGEPEEWLVAARRLRWVYRWVLPFFVFATILTMFIYCGVAWGQTLGSDLKNEKLWRPILFPTVAMFFVGGATLVSFLFSRYLSGMSREPHWRMLRACSIYLFGISVVGLLIVLSLMLQTPFPIVARVLACVITILFLVLGIEFLGNFVLDFYRPRQPGEPLRPAFESRLIGLVSEPGGIARSIADAVNYQFGFDVSTTWFYRLLEESVVRLIALCIVVLVAMTSITVVDADEQAFIERRGRQLPDVLKPGLHFKNPWPVDQVLKEDVRRVKQIIIGESSTQKDQEEHLEEVITWTKEHLYVPSIDVLVATPELGRLSQDELDETGSLKGRAVAVSILRISMPVQYRIKSDPAGFANYLYNYVEPEDMLRDVAYRELVKQAVSFDYKKVMSQARGQVAAELQRNIQAKCDNLQLGIEVVYVGLQEVHPPTEEEVALTFQAVATAQQQRETLVQAARIDYTKDLVETAGEETRAERIYAFFELKDLLSSHLPEQALAKIEGYLEEDAEKYRDLEGFKDRLASGKDIAAVLTELEQHLRDHVEGNAEKNILPIRGLAGERLAIARANAVDRVSQAAAKAGNFELELAAYNASPRLYKMRKALDALSSELNGVRKYVLMVDPEKTNVIIEVDERETSGLEIVDQSGPQ